MASVLACLMLLSVGGLQWEQRASALPASTLRVRAGEDAVLPCPLLDATSRATGGGPNSSFNWFRKAEGQTPEFLLSVRFTNRSHVKYGTGVGPDKVSAAADGSLRLRASQRGDSAVYYCSVSQGGEWRNNRGK